MSRLSCTFYIMREQEKLQWGDLASREDTKQVSVGFADGAVRIAS